MKALPDNPSKAQEIEHFRAFMKSLPADSYLRNMFGGMESYVEHQIENDFGWNIRDAMTQKEEEVLKMGKIRDDALEQVQHPEAQIKEAAKMKAIIREDLDRAGRKAEDYVRMDAIPEPDCYQIRGYAVLEGAAKNFGGTAHVTVPRKYSGKRVKVVVLDP